MKAAVSTWKHFKRSHRDGTSKKEQERGPKTKVKEAKTEKKARAGNALEPINTFAEAMICTKTYRGKKHFLKLPTSLSQLVLHSGKTAVTLKSITD